MDAKAFAEFFRACQGADPFPWQARLAEQVLTNGDWPLVVALPTGAGKTAVLDIAIFALADLGKRGVPAPRRILYVVDRRLVVDAVYERACRLAGLLSGALTGGASPVVQLVARALLNMAGPGAVRPLEVVRLRGGGFLEREWIRSPAQPTVVVSTVDQVGSRLLFRGYGLSQGETNQLAVQAGLAGWDAILFLDEAHLSEAFRQTALAVAEYRTWQERPFGGCWKVVTLTATPRDGGIVFPSPEELACDEAHPVLGPRLRARKLGRLVSVKQDEELPEQMASEAGGLLADPSVRVVAVVANRVLRARRVFERVRQEYDALLLTGRVRPLDRDRLVAEWLDRIRAGRVRDPEAPRLIVVATQTIEVGADLDFDALVTEVAPLDVLRQRLGRLDRLGERGESRVVIVASEEQLGKKASDPIYGEALRETWRFLNELEKSGAGRAGRARQRASAGGLDLGWTALEASLQHFAGKGDLAALRSPAGAAPLLLPAHVDLLVQTSPLPEPDPEVALLLHGPEAAPADVQVVWRADLDPERPELWAEIVALCPPRPEEALELPVWVVRRWLADQEPDVFDVEGGQADGGAQGGRRCLRWAGPEEATVISPGQVRPGDTIIVPASSGGCDRFGWNPGGCEPVPDLAEEAAERDFIRLHPSTLKAWLADDALATALKELEVLRTAWEAGDEVEWEVRQVLETLATRAASGVASRAAALLGQRWRLLPYPDSSGFVVFGPLRPGSSDRTERSHSVGRPVSLAEHAGGVERRAAGFARALGLPEQLVSDLALAGRLHDLGKSDPRFQAWLYGDLDPETVRVARRPLLAKSGMDPRDRRARRLARERARYPAGGRHETLSVALVAGSRLMGQAHDPELVLHLIASHHGAARPFLPAVEDPDAPLVELEWDGVRLQAPAAPGLERLDSGVGERFWRLVRRYGWWGLAYLEAILRLADWRQSEEEQATAQVGGEA